MPHRKSSSHGVWDKISFDDTLMDMATRSCGYMYKECVIGIVCILLTVMASIIDTIKLSGGRGEISGAPLYETLIM
jgi:hypothetical protein